MRTIDLILRTEQPPCALTIRRVDNCFFFWGGGNSDLFVRVRAAQLCDAIREPCGIARRGGCVRCNRGQYGAALGHRLRLCLHQSGVVPWVRKIFSPLLIFIY